MLKFYIRTLVYIGLTIISINSQSQLYAHDFGTVAISGKSYTVAPTALDSHLSNSSWTTSYSSFIEFSGNSDKALSIPGNSYPGNDTYTLTFDVAPGYMCDITGIDFWRQRSNSGPQNISITINGNSIGSFTVPTSGNFIGSQTVTNSNNLTGTITIVLTLSGATGAGGTFRIDDFTLTGVTYSSGIYSIQDGDWSTSSTWNTNSVPLNTDNVTINHAITMDYPVTRDVGTQTVISAGHSLAVRATYTNNGITDVSGTFQLDNNGYVNGNNFFNYFPGSFLVFNNGGNYDVNSGQKFWPSISNAPDNIEINTGSSATLNDGTKTVNNLILWGGFINNNSITINGNLEINTNGYVANTPPQYGNSSNLIYRSNTIYGIGQEWRASSQPHNVQITNSTTLNYTTLTEPRSITGDLSIDAGSSFYMDFGGVSSNGPLQVNGNISVSGNLSLGYAYGDDLKLMGNLTFNSGYNFYPNKRTIYFIKPSGLQEIFTPGNAGLLMDYLVIGASGGSGTTVRLNQNLSIYAPNGGNVISFSKGSDVLDLNGKNLILGTNGIANTISGDGGFKGSATSRMSISGNGNIGTISFIPGSQILENLVINRTAALLAMSLGSNLTLVGNGSDFVNGILNIDSYNLTFDINANYTGGDINSFIQAEGTGQVIKKFTAATSFVFPVGDLTSGNDYSPVSITLNSLTGTPTIGINVTDGKHPNNTSPTNFTTRYWNATSSGTFNADATFNYTDGDVNGTESSILAAGYLNPNWYMYQPVNTTTNTLPINGETNLNRAFTGGDVFTPIATNPNSHFRSHQSGNWNVAGNWEFSPDGTSWYYSSTIVPDQQAKSITVQNAHTITLASDASARKLKINAGGTLDNTHSSTFSGYELTITDDGTPASDLDIYGKFILYGKQPILSGIDPKANVYTGGIVRADDNYSPGLSDEFASNTKVNWKTGAIFDWNTSNAFSTSGEIYFPNAGPSEIAIFRISQNVSVGAGADTYFNGLMQINSNSNFSAGGKKYFRNGICGNGILNQDNTSGNFIINGTSAILGGNNLHINLTKVLNLTTSVDVPLDSSVTISGANVDKSNDAGNILTVKGIFDMTSQNITNTKGNISVTETGTYRTSHSGGFTGTGSSIPSDNVSLLLGSTIEFYRNGDQPVVSRGDYSNLILSGAGVKTPTGTFSPIGTLTIKGNATFDCTGKNIGGINTNLTMADNSTLIVNTTGTQPSMDGVYNITGGVVKFMHTGSGETIKSRTYNNIEVWGSNVGNSSGNIMLRENGSFTVKPFGIFTINDESIKAVVANTASVIIEGGGKFICGNDQGFNGYIPSGAGDFTSSSIHGNINNITLKPGSIVEYSRMGSQPITNAYGLQYQNLILSGTGNKTAPSTSLVIKGNFSKTTASVFDHNNGTVEFNSNQDQTFTSAIPYPVFYDLITNNTSMLHVNSPLSVKNLLSMKEDSKTSLANDITLLSGNGNTAGIDKIPSSAQITYGAANGRFIVERYIPSHPRAWQLLSVPTKGSTVKESWQNNRPAVYIPGKGVNITAPFADWNGRGFDKQSFAPSMKYYDPNSDLFIGIENTGINIDDHSAYFLFVRGDRSAIDVNSPATEVTLHTRGKIYEPNNPPAIVSILPGKWEMIGNPYASAINFNNLGISPEIENSYYIWDPKLTTNPSVYGLGAYRKITVASNGELTAVPSDPLYDDGEYPPIQSGQAFFVYNTSTTNNSTITFSENAKVTGSYSVLRTGKGASTPKIAVNLFLEINGGKMLMDGTLQIFAEEYDIDVDKYDAKKMMNNGENISIRSFSYPLIIEKRPLPSQYDTTFYNITGMNKRNYILQLNATGLSSKSVAAILNDKYAKTQQLLAEGINEYPFTIDSNKLSSDTNRFFVTYKILPPPFAFKNESAVPNSESVDIKWHTTSGDQVLEFQIETSKDSFQFISVKKLSAGAASEYSWTHYQPVEGTTFYRIRALLKDGTDAYSKILKSTFRLQPVSISLFPNPAAKYILLHLTRQPEGKYSIQVINAEGRQVQAKTLSHKISTTHKITLGNHPAGVYYLKIIGPGMLTHIEKFIIEK